jgi:hypothetical protein
MFLFECFCLAKVDFMVVVLLIFFARVSLKSEKGEFIYYYFYLIFYVCLQGIKDTVRWPRPRMPPVVQMERKWALEYGNPFFVFY